LIYQQSSEKGSLPQVFV